MNNESLLKKFHLDKIDKSWLVFFQQEEKKDYFFPLLKRLEEEYTNYKCWPVKEKIFRLFWEIALDKIKVVILGQDPYHQAGVADGIAFSTEKSNYIPASLKNIFWELSREFNCSPPTHGNLLPWVKEGVFLLNTALTVRQSTALSHVELWQEFIYSLINFLRNYDRQLVWVFWGQKAKKIKECCQIEDKYSVVSTHPSPYSAERGFFHSAPFSQINQLLKILTRSEINWLTISNPSLNAPK